jgi:hypothetical protein
MNYKFTEAELADFKRFWESEVGKKYLKKMTETKTQLLDAAMSSVDKDYVYRSTAIANGFQSVLLDIKAIIAGTGKKEDKKTAEETKQ